MFIITAALSLAAIAFTNVIFSAGAGRYAVVEVDGEIYGKYKLGERKSDNILEIRTKYGYNKVVIQNDGAYVSEADCRDRLDVAAGKITRAGELIVCLPHRLVITIEGESGVDGVAY